MKWKYRTFKTYCLTWVHFQALCSTPRCSVQVFMPCSCSRVEVSALPSSEQSATADPCPMLSPLSSEEVCAIKSCFCSKRGLWDFLFLSQMRGEKTPCTHVWTYMLKKKKTRLKKMCLVHENREHFMSLVLWVSCSVVSVCGKSGKTVIPVAQTLGSLFCGDGQSCVASQHWGLRPLLQRELLQGRKLLLKLEEKSRKATGGGIAEQDAIQCLLSVELQVLCSIMHFLVRRKKKNETIVVMASMLQGLYYFLPVSISFLFSFFWHKIKPCCVSIESQKHHMVYICLLVYSWALCMPKTDLAQRRMWWLVHKPR